MVEPGMAEDPTPADQIEALKRELTTERQRREKAETEVANRAHFEEGYRQQLTAEHQRAEKAEAELAAVKRYTTDARKLVELQALDEGLWFEAKTAPEAYLQRALRALHAAVEKSDSKP